MMTTIRVCPRVIPWCALTCNDHTDAASDDLQGPHVRVARSRAMWAPDGRGQCHLCMRALLEALVREPGERGRDTATARSTSPVEDDPPCQVGSYRRGGWTFRLLVT